MQNIELARVSQEIMGTLNLWGSLLTDQQNKSSGTYQQGKQHTDDERDNRVRTVRRLRHSAFLRRSDTQPKEKLVHRG
jgi:hypothetical protein